MSSHVCAFVVSLSCLLPLSLVPLRFLTLLLVLCPEIQPPWCRERRAVNPIRTRKTRSIAPWRYTTLSHSVTMAAKWKILKPSSLHSALATKLSSSISSRPNYCSLCRPIRNLASPLIPLVSPLSFLRWCFDSLNFTHDEASFDFGALPPKARLSFSFTFGGVCLGRKEYFGRQEFRFHCWIFRSVLVVRVRVTSLSAANFRLLLPYILFRLCSISKNSISSLAFEIPSARLFTNSSFAPL